MSEGQIIIIVLSFVLLLMWGISQWWDKTKYKQFWEVQEKIDRENTARHEERVRVSRIVQQEFGIKPKGKK